MENAKAYCHMPAPKHRLENSKLFPALACASLSNKSKGGIFIIHAEIVPHLIQRFETAILLSLTVHVAPIGLVWHTYPQINTNVARQLSGNKLALKLQFNALTLLTAAEEMIQ